MQEDLPVRPLLALQQAEVEAEVEAAAYIFAHMKAQKEAVVEYAKVSPSGMCFDAAYAGFAAQLVVVG